MMVLSKASLVVGFKKDGDGVVFDANLIEPNVVAGCLGPLGLGVRVNAPIGFSMLGGQLIVVR